MKKIVISTYDGTTLGHMTLEEAKKIEGYEVERMGQEIILVRLIK